MIFTFFDPVKYGKGELTNIFKNYRSYIDRVLVKYRLKNYYIKGSPRPEQLAYKLYGNTELYWVLLLINNIYDPYYDWVTDQETAYQQAIQRYRFAGGNQVVFHMDHKGEKYYNLVEHPVGTGNWYDKGDEHHRYLQYSGTLRAIDTYEEFTLKNEDKRSIMIIDPSDISRFVDDVSREMEKAL